MNNIMNKKNIGIAAVLAGIIAVVVVAATIVVGVLSPKQSPSISASAGTDFISIHKATQCETSLQCNNTAELPIVPDKPTVLSIPEAITNKVFGVFATYQTDKGSQTFKQIYQPGKTATLSLQSTLSQILLQVRVVTYSQQDNKIVADGVWTLNNSVA